MSMDFNQTLHQAIGLHQQGKYADAEVIYRKLQKSHPKHPDPHHLLGVIAYQYKRLDEAKKLIETAIRLHPDESKFYSNLGNVLHDMQRYDDAIKAYARAIALDEKKGTNNPVILCNLGNSLLSEGRHKEAAVVIKQAYAIAPDDLDIKATYALLNKVIGRYGDAIGLYLDILEKNPDSLPVRTNLANTLADAAYYDEARIQYNWILERAPDYSDVRYGFAIMLWRSRDLVGALAQLQYGLDIDERYFDAHHGMVTILEMEADHVATLQAFRTALMQLPHAQQLQSVLAYASDFDPTLGAAEQQQVRKDWYTQQVVPLGIKHLPLKVSRDPNRKLRVGFIPGRFYRNASVYAYLPVLLQLNPDEFEIWCYDGFFQSDDFTRQIQARATGWCDIARMTNKEVAERVRDDKIDILVDLFAHAGANRLPVYAYKPAPIQVTAWGHANGTGMADMDYLFSDPVSIPPEEVGLYAEHVHYLPCQLSFWLPENAPAVAPLPIEQNGFVTFGCFNRMIKVSDAVLELWAQLLVAVPDSRLVLKAAELEKEEQQKRVLAIFTKHGVEPRRLTFYKASAWFDHLQRYAEVDFALDPFPMGGGVTTLDALWMGIPVICLRGKTLGQRITSAIMTAIGLPDWVSDSQEAYLQLAIAKAQDVVALKKLRASLRLRMSASPLANPEYYVGCVEDAFRTFWRTWCAEPASRLPQPLEARFSVSDHAQLADKLWQDFLAVPDAPDVIERIADSMRRAKKDILAAEFLNLIKKA